MVGQHLSGRRQVPVRSAEMILATRQLLQAKSHLTANPPRRATQPVLERNLDFASQQATQLMLLLVGPVRPLHLFLLQNQRLQLAKDSPVL
jgi:hypothetical protein